MNDANRVRAALNAQALNDRDAVEALERKVAAAKRLLARNEGTIIEARIRAKVATLTAELGKLRFESYWRGSAGATSCAFVAAGVTTEVRV